MASEGKNVTNLLSIKNDKESVRADFYESEKDKKEDKKEAKGLKEEKESSEDMSYEDSDLFSDKDYNGFMFVQDVTCSMNSKARIPNSWIRQQIQPTIFVFMNKKLLKNTRDVHKALSFFTKCWNDYCNQEW